MTNTQQKIVSEILNEYKNKKHVIGMCVFGSVALGKEGRGSDVDVSIIFDDNREWELFKENRYGIKVDLEIVTKKDWKMMLKKYPYLFYVENNKILLDKTGFIKNALDKSKKYFDNHPDARYFWRREYNSMRKLKESKKKPRNFIAVCDEAETKFSKHHSVKRNVLTSEFFHKHIRKQ